MTDVRRVCDETCGCDVPCSGGEACRCTTTAVTGAAAVVSHNLCSCGEHCSCNPCTCGRSGSTVGGAGACTCGINCRCPTCAA